MRMFVLTILFFAGLPLAARGSGEAGACLSVLKDGEEFLVIPLAESRSFEISWIHSVEREEWQESFIADPNNGSIRVSATRFRTFGAGVPDDAAHSYIEDGWVVVRGIDRRVDPLAIRANVETEHRLVIGNEVYDLAAAGYDIAVEPDCTQRRRHAR